MQQVKLEVYQKEISYLFAFDMLHFVSYESAKDS